MQSPRIEAHFKSGLRPASALSAIQGGASLIELDVQLTADAQFIVYHDYTLPNGQWVHQTPFADCQEAIRGAESMEGVQEECILLLSDAFDLIRGWDAGVTLDLKSGIGAEHAIHLALSPAIHEAMSKSLEIHVSDWDVAGLRLLKAVAPAVTARGALRGRPVDLVTIARDGGLDGLNLAWDCTRATDVEALHGSGYIVAFFGGWGDEYRPYAQRCAVDILSMDFPPTSGSTAA